MTYPESDDLLICASFGCNNQIRRAFLRCNLCSCCLLCCKCYDDDDDDDDYDDEEKEEENNNDTFGKIGDTL